MTSRRNVIRAAIAASALLCLTTVARAATLDEIPTASVDGIDTANARLAKRFGSTKWKLTAAPQLGVTWSCFGLAKGNAKLRDYLNIARYEMHTDGTVEGLWEKWFGRPMDAKVPVTPYF